MSTPAPRIQPWKAIVAMAPNRAIGLNGTLPWHLPEDLAFFKQMTTGNTIVMGRNTMESLPKGKPLPKRRNVVITGSDIEAPGFEIIRHLDELEKLPTVGTIYIIGGAQLFNASLPLCAELYLTHVKDHYEGDTFMPPFERDFEPVETIEETEAMKIVRYRNKALTSD